MSNMELEEFAAMPLPDPMPLSNPEIPGEMTRDISEGQSSSASDTEFLNQLFNTFEDGAEEGLLDLGKEPIPEPKVEPKPNPEPELMRRLGDALTVLPAEMQETLVDRLVTQITSTDFVAGCVQQAAKVEGIRNDHNLVVPSSEEPRPEDLAKAAPLAAATFAALLHHYTSQVQGSKGVKSLPKTLPIVPAHA